MRNRAIERERERRCKRKMEGEERSKRGENGESDKLSKLETRKFR
jgi:hypothetical protein